MELDKKFLRLQQCFLRRFQEGKWILEPKFPVRRILCLLNLVLLSTTALVRHWEVEQPSGNMALAQKQGWIQTSSSLAINQEVPYVEFLRVLFQWVLQSTTCDSWLYWYMSHNFQKQPFRGSFGHLFLRGNLEGADLCNKYSPFCCS